MRDKKFYYRINADQEELEHKKELEELEKGD